MKNEIQTLFFRISVTIFLLFLLGAVIATYWQQQKETDRLVHTKSNELSVIGTAFLQHLPVDSLAKAETQGTGFTTLYPNILQRVKKFKLNYRISKGITLRIVRLKDTISEIVFDEKGEQTIGKPYDLWLEMKEANKTDRQTFHFEKRNNQYLLSAIYPVKYKQSMTDLLVLTEENLTRFKTSLLAAFYPHAFALFILFVIIELFLLIFLHPLNIALKYLNESLQRLREKKSLLKPEFGTKCLSGEIYLLGDLNNRIKEVEESHRSREEEQKQIKEFLRIVTAAAEGDLTVQANVTADALGALSDSFNLMISDLSALTRDVKKAASQVASKTDGILANMEEMAKGAVDQATQTETISQLAKEMNELISDTNESAQKAAQSAQKARDVAKEGSEIVKKAIQGMHTIRDAVRESMKQVRYLDENSTRIGEISDFIAEISSRTNLLALNASIEAARAGEAGKGFSVVAEEIRNLAERTNSSAEEISKLIEAIQETVTLTLTNIEKGNKEVGEGTRLMDSAGDALREILEKVEVSSDASTSISEATKHQTQYSRQITVSLEEIAGIAKENARHAQQSKEAAEQLEALSKELNNAVEKFKLSN